MPFDKDIAGLYSQTIDLQPPSTEDDRGNRTFGTAITFKAFLQYNTREFRTQTMESRVPRAIINVAPIEVTDNNVEQYVNFRTDARLETLSPEWQITLPDGSHPPIVNIDRAFGDPTLDHLVIFL